MKNISKYWLLLGILFIASCSRTTINSFEECVAAGNPVLESYPLQCKTSDGRTFTQETTAHFCTDEEKAAEICTMDYSPVCGDNGKTYSNGCTACASGEIDSYETGECEIIIGGQRDEFGCLVPAGFSWDKDIGACTRNWELDENAKNAAKIAVAPLSYIVTVVEVIENECEGCYIVKLQRNDNQEYFEVVLDNWTTSE